MPPFQSLNIPSCNTMNLSTCNLVNLPSRNPVNLPAYNSVKLVPTVNKPLTHYSPLPPFTRKFDMYGKPSPTAVVGPICRQQTVKEETVAPPDCCVRKTSNDIFEVSSDSESGQDMSEIVEQIIKKQPSARKFWKIKKSATNTSEVTNIDSAKSTPLQRSIRRYGRIKKCINPFSPSPVVQKKVTCKDQFDGSTKKVPVTLDDHWKEAVTAKNMKAPPSTDKLPARLTRGSLAMKRKQENVFNFNGDDDEDLKHLAGLLQKKQRSRRMRTSV